MPEAGLEPQTDGDITVLKFRIKLYTSLTRDFFWLHRWFLGSHGPLHHRLHLPAVGGDVPRPILSYVPARHEMAAGLEPAGFAPVGVPVRSVISTTYRAVLRLVVIAYLNRRQSVSRYFVVRV